MPKRIKNTFFPVVLNVLDGWGMAPPSEGNAITLAKTPVMDMLTKKYPHTTLCAYGSCVGLPAHQDGNSEAGHMNLGTGRVVDQDSLEISQAISTGVFFKNPAFLSAVEHVKQYKSNLHLMGLLSEEQSAHVDPDHILALLTLLRQRKLKNVYLHLFTDGRDSPQYLAIKLLDKIQRTLRPNEHIVSLTGRYYAMDRKKKWQNIQKTYEAIVLGKGLFFSTPRDAILHAYNQGVNDEFISPSLIASEGERCKLDGSVKCQPKILVSDNDALIFFNLRSDRARELTKTFVQRNFEKMNPASFRRKKVLKNLYFVAMTDFGPDLGDIFAAFPSRDLKGTLPMAMKDFRQLYLAESEKYAHVTYFFNGGYSAPVAGEGRVNVKSPTERSYDEKPEMSAHEVTKTVVESLRNRLRDFIVVNFANPDMVGHTGNLKAGIKAVEVVDECVGRIYEEMMSCKGILIVTADHGNIEEMINLKTGEIDTKHSTNPVPFILIDLRPGARKILRLKKDGVLGDVAPTILKLLKIKKPKEMRREGLLS